MQRDREERRKERDCAYINAQSRRDHELDVKRNAEPKPFFRRKQDTQHPNSAEFAKKWGTR